MTSDALRFLDTNVLLRYFTRDDEAKAHKALALLSRIESGEEKVETSLLVIFEAVYTLQRLYRVPRARIRDLLVPLLHLRGLRLPNKGLCIEALDLFADSNISFAAAFNAAYMQGVGVTEVYSWDPDMDKVEGLKRIEPEG